jgi:hypothetical protein
VEPFILGLIEERFGAFGKIVSTIFLVVVTLAIFGLGLHPVRLTPA